jgi:hypothetical protein
MYFAKAPKIKRDNGIITATPFKFTMPSIPSCLDGSIYYNIKNTTCQEVLEVAMAGYIPVLNRWDPSLAEKETEPYLRFILYRIGELLHFKTKAPRSLPILSTIYLMRYLRGRDWQRESVPKRASKLIPLLEDLQLRLKKGAWIKEYWPKEISQLEKVLSQNLPLLKQHLPLLKQSVSPKNRAQSLREKIFFTLREKLETILNGLEEFHQKTDLLSSYQAEIEERIILLEKEAIVKLICNQTIPHEQKLLLLDLYITDFIRDLLHYGHNMNFLIRIWLTHRILNPSREEDPRTYLERFSALEGLLEGEKKFTVLNRVLGSEGIVGTSEFQLLEEFPAEYKNYQGYEEIKKWYETPPHTLKKPLEAYQWIKQEVQAKDAYAAGMEATRHLLRYSEIISRLTRGTQEQVLHVSAFPFVINEQLREIYAAPFSRPLDLGAFPNTARIYKIRERHLSSDRFNRKTFEFLMGILDWILQAERFYIKSRKLSIPGSALFISLWTAFAHLFAEVDWHDHLPPYVALRHIFQELRHFSRLLRYFEEREMLSSKTADLKKIQSMKEARNESEMLDLCRQIYLRKDETLSLLKKESFLEYKLLKLVQLHPATEYPQEQKGEKRFTLLGELEELEIKVRSNLVLLPQSRHDLVHEVGAEIGPNEFYLLTQYLTYYLSQVLEHFTFQFNALYSKTPTGLHHATKANYERWKKEILSGALASDTRTLLNPHWLMRKPKSNRSSQRLKGLSLKPA